MLAATNDESTPGIHIINEAQLDQARLKALSAEFSGWARRVYRYLHVSKPAPVNLIVTHHAQVGMYMGEDIYLPVDDHDEMLETFIHELSHQATGHESSYFFKEGIATHTLEALFEQERRQMPQGWPQYGASNDAWVNLFLRSQQLMPLQEALDWPQYDGRNAEGDYHSWQVYLIAGSFSGWYISRYGYAAFKQAFDTKKLLKPVKELETLWLDSIRLQNLAPFDPAQQLPSGRRYQRFAEHLQ